MQIYLFPFGLQLRVFEYYRMAFNWIPVAIVMYELLLLLQSSFIIIVIALVIAKVCKLSPVSKVFSHEQPLDTVVFKKLDLHNRSKTQTTR